MVKMEAFGDWLMWAIGGVVSGMLWLIRKVFTNEKRIEVLHQELKDFHEDSKESRKMLSTAIDRNTDLLIDILKDKKEGER